MTWYGEKKPLAKIQGEYATYLLIGQWPDALKHLPHLSSSARVRRIPSRHILSPLSRTHVEIS